MNEGLPVGDARLMLPFGGRKVECATFSMPTQEMRALAVICHPHPLFGGAMDNKVVHTLWRTFKSEGINVLRFNFRGVGESEGQHDGGEGETDDLAAIIGWLAKCYPDKPVYLAGFSFGAYVAAAYAARESRNPLARLFLVAPPVHHFNMEAVRRLDVPTSIIMGQKDELVPAEQVQLWTKRLSESALARLHLLPDATHFFHGQLSSLKELVVADLALE